LAYLLVLPFNLLLGIHSSAANSSPEASDIVLVASTPGNDVIKSLLAIPPDKKIDFIRWNLVLTNPESERHSFSLDINYGEAQPNTSGFKNGGEKKSIEGEYGISQEKGLINGKVYHLKSPKLADEIQFIKLSENIYHLISPQMQLMVGNGGWSYTLNRKEPLSNCTTVLPVLTAFSSLPADTSRQIIFEGRTPCLDIAREKNLVVSADCFKLKWKLVLSRDPKTLLPTTYRLYRTNSRQNDLTGNWVIKKGSGSNSNAIIYQLDSDKPDKSISLYLADENVAFFLHDDNEFFTGDENFSYTLNRRQ